MAQVAEKKRKLEQERLETPTKKLKKSGAASSLNGSAVKSPAQKSPRSGNAKAVPTIQESALPTSTPRSVEKQKVSRKESKASKRSGSEVPGSTTHKTGPQQNTTKSESGSKDAEPVAADSRKLSRKEEKALRRAAKHGKATADTAEQRASKLDTPDAKQSKERKPSARDVQFSEIVPAENSWSFSAPTTGRFLDVDPVYVQDENGHTCLLAATDTAVQLLSLDTSLVIRSHLAPEGLQITAFAATTSSAEIAYDDGTTVIWNFCTGSTGQGLGDGMVYIAAMAIAADAESYYIQDLGEKSGIACRGKVLFETSKVLECIEVHGNASYIVAWGPLGLVLGTQKTPSAASEDSSEFIWVEFTMKISCAASRLVPAQGDAKKQKTRRPDLALAVGNEEGQIHLYSNVSVAFGKNAASLPAPQILHWHRHAASAVKFSRDGNYLISGGKETVLVLWQLATGKTQFLPHLTAEIEQIVVSPDGTQYTLQLGDNSIMVLSTSELKALAHFPGLQVLTTNTSTGPAGEQSMQSRRKTAAVLHPVNVRRLLVTVPSSVPQTSPELTTRPFLQTFDIRSDRHCNRQALTRNNVTDFNEGPEGNAIISPDVSAIAISPDGQWLATVDEWSPPATDLRHVVGETSAQTAVDVDGLEEAQEQRGYRQEIHLKFWQWDETEQLWTLNTRADEPHGRYIGADMGSGAGKILKLLADPTSRRFVTIGEDSQVKIWQPKTQMRHGLPLRDQNGLTLTEWTCRRTTPMPVLPHADSDRADSPLDSDLASSGRKIALRDACLAFSPDGSLLACAQVCAEDTAQNQVVHFISTDSGVVLDSKGRLTLPDADLVDLAFLDRYFIAVSTNSIRVWNLVDDVYHWTVALALSPHRLDDPLLAVNHLEGTFVVAATERLAGSGEDAFVARVFSPRASASLFEVELAVAPTAILSGKSTHDFTFLFEDGTIRTLASASTTSVSRAILEQITAANDEHEITTDAVVGPAEETVGADGVEDVDMPDDIPDLESLSMGVDPLDGDDRTVVRPEQLASIFDVGTGMALPPVRDMFQSVVDLYARKPRNAGIAVEA